MLDVQRAVDVDAGGDQLFHVLPALRVSRAGRVGVRQLVHQQQAGAAGQGCVKVELLESDAAILQAAPRELRHALEQGGGLGPAVGLDHADHDVHALPGLGARRLQHGVGLAHAGRGAEEDLEAPAARLPLLLANPGEQGFGVGTAVLGGHDRLTYCRQAHIVRVRLVQLRSRRGGAGARARRSGRGGSNSASPGTFFARKMAASSRWKFRER